MGRRILQDECATWLSEVDDIMKRDWLIDTVGAGLSDEEITSYWRFGDTPSQFVSWFAEERNLIDFAGVWGRTAERPSDDP